MSEHVNETQNEDAPKSVSTASGISKDPGFPGRGKVKGWKGPLVDYKDIETLRKFLTTSSKLMSRKRAGTNTQEQKALKIAVKQARFLALIPYSGS